MAWLAMLGQAAGSAGGAAGATAGAGMTAAQEGALASAAQSAPVGGYAQIGANGAVETGMGNPAAAQAVNPLSSSSGGKGGSSGKSQDMTQALPALQVFPVRQRAEYRATPDYKQILDSVFGARR
jgi:hypothetical protein